MAGSVEVGSGNRTPVIPAVEALPRKQLVAEAIVPAQVRESSSRYDARTSPGDGAHRGRWMFSPADGPTALRANLVRMLLFSIGEPQQVTLETPDRCIAALAAVWNGSEGFVAALVRCLDRPAIHRFTCDQQILSSEALEAAIGEGQEFVLSLGFRMDEVDFTALDEAARAERLARWNALRKPDSGATAEELTAALTRSATSPAAAAGPRPAGGDASRAALGRIELVRHEGPDAHPDPRARIFSFF